MQITHVYGILWKSALSDVYLVFNLDFMVDS
jgi:hypothetical protein